MADAVQQARQLLPQLRQAVETDAAAAKSRDLLTQLKASSSALDGVVCVSRSAAHRFPLCAPVLQILMTQFPSQTASDRTTSPSDEEAAIARECSSAPVFPGCAPASPLMKLNALHAAPFYSQVTS